MYRVQYNRSCGAYNAGETRCMRDKKQADHLVRRGIARLVPQSEPAPEGASAECLVDVSMENLRARAKAADISYYWMKSKERLLEELGEKQGDEADDEDPDA